MGNPYYPLADIGTLAINGIAENIWNTVEVAPNERIPASLLNLARICELDARLVAVSQIQISESRELLLRANAVRGTYWGRIAQRKVLRGAKSRGPSSGKIDALRSQSTDKPEA